MLRNTHLFEHRSFWPIDRTLTYTTTLDLSEPGRNVNEEMLNIPQSSRSGASSSDSLVSHPRHSLVWDYLSAEMESAYSTIPAELAENRWIHAFIKGITTKGNKQRRPRFELYSSIQLAHNDNRYTKSVTSVTGESNYSCDAQITFGLCCRENLKRLAVH